MHTQASQAARLSSEPGCNRDASEQRIALGERVRSDVVIFTMEGFRTILIVEKLNQTNKNYRKSLYSYRHLTEKGRTLIGLIPCLVLAS